MMELSSKKLSVALTFFALIVLISFDNYAQEKEGIKFETDLSWSQIKEKARKENRYIFLDVYTTWCVPCREMAKYIFPKAEVGDFFNGKFINVAVQCDTTAKDSEAIKKWYNDAKIIGETYGINSYPTYLFFNPEGNLVHYFKGSSNSANAFLLKVKQALDPKSQYINLKDQYKNGKRDSVFLLALINTAILSGDNMNARDYMQVYLHTQKELLTKRNLDFIAKSTTKSTDIGFSVLRNYPKLIDSVAGEGRSYEIITGIAFDEVVFPLIRKNGLKTYYGGGMVVYSGELNENVDWSDIKLKLDTKYPDLSEQILIKSKIDYYSAKEDWKSYFKIVRKTAFGNKKINASQLDAYARTVLLSCDDLKYVKIASDWSKRTLAANGTDKTSHLETYSYLLYKLGEKKKAINMMQLVLKQSVNPNETVSNYLLKMEKNEKIW